MFKITSNCTTTSARAGIINTDHGKINTPFFMPIATYGAVNTCQTFDGSSWTTGSVTLRINQHQQGFSFGSSTAAIIGGGAGATTGTSYASNQDHADTWNGSTFSAAATVPYGLNDMMGAGSQAAGTAFGGGGGSPVDTCVTYA